MCHAGYAMSDEWYTPKSVFDSLGLTFDLDVCSPKGGTGLVPALKSYCQEEDGLLSPWFGRVWMNPPYSKPSPWIDKWLAHGNGVALLPMAKSRWFNDLMNTDAHFTLLPSNFKFVSPEGKPISLMMGSILWAIGDDNVEAIAKIGKVR
jgi:hypothetical protein